LVFLVGNPGILPLYQPFIEKLSTSSPNLAVFGHALFGHVSELPAPPSSTFTLDAQIDGNVELLDSLLTLVDKNTKVVLCGHSVGSWIMCQVAKRRPERVDALFLLTPTLCKIASTPNGRRQSWMFAPFGRFILPICARLLIPFAKYISPHVLPTGMQSKVDHAHWEMAKIKAAEFISNPNILIAALTLAWYEMKEIADLDRAFLQQNREKIFILWAKTDNWVGNNRQEVEEALGLPHDQNHERASEGPDIPHAFCFQHNEDVADICIRWLRESVWKVGGTPGGPKEVESQAVSQPEAVEEAIM